MKINAFLLSLLFGLTGLAPLWSQGEQMVHLKDMNLSMKELAEEASRQSGILVILDVVENEGPRVQYDCSYSLKGIVTAIKGYYKFRLGLDLEERWDQRSVTLKPVTRKIEVTDVRPAEEAPAKKEVQPKPREASFISRFWKRLSSGEREKDTSDSATESTTNISKFEIKESEKPLEMGGDPVDPVGVIPSRMKVETVILDDDVVDPFEHIDKEDEQDDVIDLVKAPVAPAETLAPALAPTPAPSRSVMDLEDLEAGAKVMVVSPAPVEEKPKVKEEIKADISTSEEVFPDL